ncbi:hypothetical protein BLNAU_8514 [Blattamonas nauphoetae]|uniref:FPL domain-containing protein n=1 Tax=Blattamonas nauphoetae TaxID=2049346 RepID=A0ABQ9XY85_9EUKA|nr:hypothetical protein BLNAU_8514 [Blattamonas nauphoetae]
MTVLVQVPRHVSSDASVSRTISAKWASIGEECVISRIEGRESKVCPILIRGCRIPTPCPSYKRPVTELNTDTCQKRSYSECSPFLNWDDEKLASEDERVVVFRSLVATVKFKHAFDVSLETKAVKILESVKPRIGQSADAIVSSLASNSDEYLTDFVESIMVLLSSANSVITTTTMKMLDHLFYLCSTKLRLALVKADLIPQVLNILNPLSLSFTEAVDIHVHLLTILANSFFLSTPGGLSQLAINDNHEQQAVHETIFQQVLAPSEKYIGFILSIPSCLTTIDVDVSIHRFLFDMVNSQREWNRKGDAVRQLGNTVLRMLRMEGFEDVIEEKLQNDRDALSGIETNQTRIHLQPCVPSFGHQTLVVCALCVLWHHLVVSPNDPDSRSIVAAHSIAATVSLLRNRSVRRVGVNDDQRCGEWSSRVHWALEIDSVSSASTAPISLFLSPLLHRRHVLLPTFVATFPLHPPRHLTHASDCYAFLNWDEEELESENEKAVVFRSLVATLRLQPTLDDTLEWKAVTFLEFVDPIHRESAQAFLSCLGQTTDEPWTDFIESIMVLLSSTSYDITVTTMIVLDDLFYLCSSKIRLSLIKADLILQLITTLNPLSLSLVEAADIHTGLVKILRQVISFSTSDGLTKLGVEDRDEQHAVHEIVLPQALAPSKEYICHLCGNRNSNMDGCLPDELMLLISQLLQISIFYQRTMDFVQNMPVALTIPCCLTFIEFDSSISMFMNEMIALQREWNKERGEVRQRWKTVRRMLRMEGIEDVFEQKLRNDQKELEGGFIVSNSIDWNNLQGMNLARQE